MSHLKISAEPPPNYAAVLAAFPFAARPGTVFCYGWTCHIPGGPAHLAAALIAHETVHAKRQTAFDGGPAAWWDRYLVDPGFRFLEELPAHVAEYQWFADFPRGQRTVMLRQIAARLAGPLYGRLVTIHEAKRLITGKDVPSG